MTMKISKPTRQFIDQDLIIDSWGSIEQYFENLASRIIESESDFKQWLSDQSELDAIIEENAAWRYIKMTINTKDKELSDNYTFFISEIQPKIAPYEDLLNRKLNDSPFSKLLSKEADSYKIMFRKVKSAIALYKESALETVAASNQYDTVSLNLESSLNVWQETKEQLDSLVNNYTGRLADDIKADLDALDPDSETYQADLASLEEEKTTYNAFVLSNNTLAGIVNEDVATVEANRVSLSTAEQQYEEALAIEQAILSEELNSPNLSVEALAELRSLLDL